MVSRQRESEDRDAAGQPEADLPAGHPEVGPQDGLQAGRDSGRQIQWEDFLPERNPGPGETWWWWLLCFSKMKP